MKSMISHPEQRKIYTLILDTIKATVVQRNGMDNWNCGVTLKDPQDERVVIELLWAAVEMTALSVECKVLRAVHMKDGFVELRLCFFPEKS